MAAGGPTAESRKPQGPQGSSTPAAIRALQCGSCINQHHLRSHFFGRSLQISIVYARVGVGVFSHPPSPLWFWVRGPPSVFVTCLPCRFLLLIFRVGLRMVELFAAAISFMGFGCGASHVVNLPTSIPFSGCWVRIDIIFLPSGFRVCSVHPCPIPNSFAHNVRFPSAGKVLLLVPVGFLRS